MLTGIWEPLPEGYQATADELLAGRVAERAHELNLAIKAAAEAGLRTDGWVREDFFYGKHNQVEVQCKQVYVTCYRRQDVRAVRHEPEPAVRIGGT